MKRISETVLLESVKSLRETMALLEAGDYNRSAATSAIGASEHPMQNFSDYMNQGKDTVNNAIGHAISDPVATHGRGAHVAPQKPLGLTNPEQYPDLSPAGEFELPHPEAAPYEFNPSDTSYAQDHPPVDDLGGPSDLDKVIPTQAAPHPAGQPKTPKAKFDPAVQKLQYELQAKGYPIKADGVLGPKTQQAIDWEHRSTSTNNAIQDYPALQATMDEPITAPEPFDNTQGDFDRQPELNEHVTFSQGDSLARIIQLARG